MNKNNIKSIIIGFGSCGIAAGAKEVFDFFKEKIKEKNLSIQLEITGCIGMCYKEVIVEVSDSKGHKIMYGEITPQKADRIFEEHILKQNPVKEWIIDIDLEKKGSGFLAKQKRIVLRNCGKINPESIGDYIKSGGYKALTKVLKEFSPEEVIKQISDSGLRGRGGAGFPTGKKWSFARQATGDPKYIICNADEGDPGAFMDRSVLEGDPHSVLEGMIIAAFAVGASKGFIYVRAEYPLAVKRLKIALEQVREKKFLGENILNTGFSFDIKIKEGAGAFVCGEETALIKSIEGRRGMPMIRPPYPVNSGLWGKPTFINNVETLANVPWIILNGAEKYSELGYQKSKGTKVFALAGKIKKTGLVEVPMGLTLREVIFDIGGGSSTKKDIKAVQIGGPSGGCLPLNLLDIPIDYEAITKTGAIVGSGGLIAVDEGTCMVDVAKFFLNFTQNESCGKCTFCRVGTKRMLEILTRITEGKGCFEDLELLRELAEKVSKTSLCGLGQTAPNPVLTTLKYFKDEYKAHIEEKRCPAGVCKALITYKIDSENCTGCGACVRVCGIGAITGEKKEPHIIDEEKCIRCGACLEVCKFDAVKVN